MVVPKTLCNHLSYKLNYPHFPMNTISLGRITENYDYSEFIVCLADIFLENEQSEFITSRKIIDSMNMLPMIKFES